MRAFGCGRASRLAASVVVCLAFAAGIDPGRAQTAPTPPATPAPVPATPVPTPAPVAPPPATPATPPAATATNPRPPLIAEAGDPVNVDEVILPEKPVLIVSGKSNWEGGLQALRAAFAKVEAELAKVGIAPAGRPLSVFTATTDDDFSFDAMIPIAATPTPPPAVATDMRFGVTPSGKAYRFVHEGPYDGIDTTYETITTYLDAKDIVAKDAFIEEYLNDVSDPADAGLKINIYVQPR